ncbi:MAG: hypothetical protein V1787_01455 [Candidatus Micrarchaeota archaeon]
MRYTTLLAAGILATALLAGGARAAEYTDCNAMPQSCLVEFTDGQAPPLNPPDQGRSLDDPLDLKVDTERHGDAGEYADRPGAVFENGEALHLAVEVTRPQEGERISIYLESGGARKRLCTYAFGEGNPDSKRVLRMQCPVPASWAPGNYLVYIAHEDIEYATLDRWYRTASRYWGHARPGYFIRVRAKGSGGGEGDAYDVQPAAPRFMWGASYMLYYTLKVSDPATGTEKEIEYEGVFTDAERGYMSFASNESFNESWKAILVRFGIKAFDAAGSEVCAWEKEEDSGKGLPGAGYNIKKGGLKCFDSNTTLVCVDSINRNQGIAAKFWYIHEHEGQDDYNGKYAVKTWFSAVPVQQCEGLLGGSGKKWPTPSPSPKPAKQPTPQATPRPTATAPTPKPEQPFPKVDNSKLVFDSKTEEARLVISPPAPIDPATILYNPVSNCITASEGFAKEPGGDNRYSLKLKYDPLCQSCGLQDAVEVQVAGAKRTIKAKFSCKADSLVVTTGKLGMGADVNAALTQYFSSHPLKSLLVVLGSEQAAKSFNLGGLQPKDAETRRLFIDALRAKTGARQIVILGDESVLPKGSVTEPGGEVVETDDAYSLRGKSGAAVWPVGRMEGFSGDDAKDTASLVKVIQRNAAALNNEDGKGGILVSGTACESCEARKALDSFSEGYSGVACKANPSCAAAPPNCMRCAGGPQSGCDEQGFAGSVKAAGLAVFLPSWVEEGRAYVKDSDANEVCLLDSETEYSFNGNAAVFVASDKAARSPALTLGRGAAALMMTRGYSLPPQAYTEIGRGLASEDTLGAAMAAAKARMAKLEPGSQYLLELIGDPSLPTLRRQARVQK